MLNCCLSYYRRGSVLIKDSNNSDWLYIVKSVSKGRVGGQLCLFLQATLPINVYTYPSGYVSDASEYKNNRSHADVICVCDFIHTFIQCFIL